MASINKVILVGNLGKDPEVKQLESGVSVATFSLATSETYKDKSGEKRESTEWHNIVLWRGLADIASKYLKKGSKVYIEGKITTRSWEDNNGNKRYTTEIVGSNMVMLSGSDSSSNSSAPPPPTKSDVIDSTYAPSGVESDDLPF